MKVELYNKLANMVVSIGSQNNCLKNIQDAGNDDYVYNYRTKVDGLPEAVAINQTETKKNKLKLRNMLAEMPYVELKSRKTWSRIKKLCG